MFTGGKRSIEAVNKAGRGGIVLAVLPLHVPWGQRVCGRHVAKLVRTGCATNKLSWDCAEQSANERCVHSVMKNEVKWWVGGWLVGWGDGARRSGGVGVGVAQVVGWLQHANIVICVALQCWRNNRCHLKSSM